MQLRPNEQTIPQIPLLLVRVLCFDLGRRFKILMEEIEHLVSAIEYRTGANLSNPLNSKGSSIALMKRIADAAAQLKEEVKCDHQELENFSNWWNVIEWESKLPSEKNALACFQQVWHQKMMMKASVVAERLGELHDRLDQQLQRSNHDGPSPILRRRSELGQIDKYLCEHVKWIHRDIAQFVSDLGIVYPYDEVPSTLQAWQYAPSSSQHSFISHVAYKAQQADPPYKKPKRFTSLGLSYWMPERIAIQPIIGHEIAHQVLQDLYGRNLVDIKLAQDTSEFGRLIKNLVKCCEAWLPSEGLRVHGLVKEIVCDLMAANRFGCAFLHAWIIEVSGDEKFVDFFHDEFGMLRPTTEFDKLTEKWIEVNILKKSEVRANERPNIYYRGKLLIAYLRDAQRESDFLTKKMLQDIDSWLETYIELALGMRASKNDSGTAAGRVACAREFTKDLADTLCRKCSRNGVFARKRDSAPWLLNPISPFIKASKEYWKSTSGLPDRFCLQRQVLSQPLRLKFIEQIVATLNDVTIPNEEPVSDYKIEKYKREIRTLNDALWRMEWAIEIKNQYCENKSIDLNAVRGLNFLAIDDYLYRTGNPHRIFECLARLPDIGSELKNLYEKNHANWFGKSNSIDDDHLKKMYLPDWLKKLTPFEISHWGGWIDINHVKIPIAKDTIERFAPLIIDPNTYCKLLQKVDLKYLFLCNMNPAQISISENIPDTKTNYGVCSKSGSVEVLGRYDLVSFAEEKPNGGGSFGYVKYLQSLLKHGTQMGAVVARQKKLLPIRYWLGDDGKSQKIICVMLVSLAWDAGRLMMAFFLQELLDAKSNYFKYHLFLSDGWEDFVLVLYETGKQDKKELVANAIATVTLMNQHPLVAGTESLKWTPSSRQT